VITLLVALVAVVRLVAVLVGVLMLALAVVVLMVLMLLAAVVVVVVVVVAPIVSVGLTSNVGSSCTKLGVRRSTRDGVSVTAARARSSRAAAMMVM
jgi:hypothetical protein